jgi:hypothetical protein
MVRTRESTQRYWWNASSRMGSQPLGRMTGQARMGALNLDGGLGLSIGWMISSLELMSSVPITAIDLPASSSCAPSRHTPHNGVSDNRG